MKISFLTELATVEETSDCFRVVTPAGTREINKVDVQSVSSISSMT
nr:hypothetical protein [Bacillus pumilus]